MVGHLVTEDDERVLQYTPGYAVHPQPFESPTPTHLKGEFVQPKTSIRDWFIRKLGGFTAAEYAANARAYEDFVDRCQASKDATVLIGVAYQPTIKGDLIVGPMATIMGAYVEGELR